MAVPVVMAAERLPTYELARNPSLQLAAMLPKPFYISQLLETVKAVLRVTDSRREQIVAARLAKPAVSSWFAAMMIPLHGLASS